MPLPDPRPSAIATAGPATPALAGLVPAGPSVYRPHIADKHHLPYGNISSMGAHSSPLPRFRRAIVARSVAQAEAAARELGRLSDEDALQLVLLLLRESDPRYERAATRLAGRVLVGHPALGFTLARDLLDGFAGLGGPAPEVARSRIALVLRRAGLERAADYVARHDLRTWR